MNTHHRFARPLRLGAVLPGLIALSCLEPQRHPAPASTLSGRELGVVLVLSDSTPVVGSIVTITARLIGVPNATPRIASYTARVVYDTVALRFAGDVPLDDKAMRLSNAAGQGVRVAGYAVGGLPSGDLFRLSWQVRTAGGAAALFGLQLSFSELHSAQHDDLRSRLIALKGRSIHD